MKDKNLKYIAHAIIVVAFMGLIAFVIYYTVKPLFFGCYYSFSCINLGREMCPGRKEDNEE